MPLRPAVQVMLLRVVRRRPKSKTAAADRQSATNAAIATLKSTKPPPATKYSSKSVRHAVNRNHASDVMKALGGIVGVLMRTKQFRTLTLSDLEALVVPALLSNQLACASTSANANGLVGPAAIALWAKAFTEVANDFRKIWINAFSWLRTSGELEICLGGSRPLRCRCDA